MQVATTFKTLALGVASRVDNDGNEFRGFLCVFVDRSCGGESETIHEITRMKHERNPDSSEI